MFAFQVCLRRGASAFLRCTCSVSLPTLYEFLNMLLAGGRGSRAIRRPFFDLSFARQFAAYDKLGSGYITNAVKNSILGNPKYRMTKKRCEAFFEDPSNFG